jgi:hypothetical protein
MCMSSSDSEQSEFEDSIDSINPLVSYIQNLIQNDLFEHIKSEKALDISRKLCILVSMTTHSRILLVDTIPVRNIGIDPDINLREGLA